MEFTTGSAIRLGWETFKLRPWFFVGASAIILLANFLASAVSAALDVWGTFEDPSPIGQVVDYFVGAAVYMGLTAFFLAAHADPKTVKLSAFLHPRPYLKFVGAYTLEFLAIVVGLILLIVPGLIALAAFTFATTIVVDQALGPIEAMKESMRITSGHRWQLLGFWIVLALTMVAGVLALGVGILVAMPVTTIAFMHAYRVLLHQAGSRRIEQVLTA